MTLEDWNLKHPFHLLIDHKQTARGLVVFSRSQHVTALYSVFVDNTCLLRLSDKHAAEFIYRLECER